MPDFKEERSGNGGVLVRSMLAGLLAGILIGPLTITVLSVVTSIGKAQTTGDAFRTGLTAGIFGDYAQVLMVGGAVIGVFTGTIAGLTWVISRSSGNSVLLTRSLAAVASAIPIVLVSLGYHIQGTGLLAVGVAVACVLLVFILSPLIAGRRQREE